MLWSAGSCRMVSLFSAAPWEMEKKKSGDAASAFSDCTMRSNPSASGASLCVSVSANEQGIMLMSREMQRSVVKIFFSIINLLLRLEVSGS